MERAFCNEAVEEAIAIGWPASVNQTGERYAGKDEVVWGERGTTGEDGACGMCSRPELYPNVSFERTFSRPQPPACRRLVTRAAPAARPLLHAGAGDRPSPRLSTLLLVQHVSSSNSGLWCGAPASRAAIRCRWSVSPCDECMWTHNPSMQRTSESQLLSFWPAALSNSATVRLG